jgi:excisionase family DNA binding protein
MLLWTVYRRVGDPLLTLPEAAARLHLRSVSTLRKWQRAERITVVYVGRLVRIPESEIARIIAEGTRPAATVRPLAAARARLTAMGRRG